MRTKGVGKQGCVGGPGASLIGRLGQHHTRPAEVNFTAHVLSLSLSLSCLILCMLASNTTHTHMHVLSVVDLYVCESAWRSLVAESSALILLSDSFGVVVVGPGVVSTSSATSLAAHGLHVLFMCGPDLRVTQLAWNLARNLLTLFACAPFH